MDEMLQSLRNHCRPSPPTLREQALARLTGGFQVTTTDDGGIFMDRETADLVVAALKEGADV
jgi:hypothetical protein